MAQSGLARLLWEQEVGGSNPSAPTMFEFPRPPWEIWLTILEEDRSAEGTLRKYAVSDWILWVGAGVSSLDPSSLPLGRPLTIFALDKTCGQSVRDKILAIWHQANSICGTRLDPQPLGGLPRLETVLGAVGEIEEGAETEALKFLRGLSSFGKAPPNPNHYAIASLVRRGTTVVTTNFDLCIQNAMTELGAPGEQPSLVGQDGLCFRYGMEDDPKVGEIVHIHGIATEAAQLGATLSKVKEGLPESFVARLEQRLRNGSIMVFLGYSANDSFDVTPFFASRTPKCWEKSVCLFLQHCDGESPKNLSRLEPGFGRSFKVRVDTATFLRQFLGSVPKHTGRFDWAKEFQQETRSFPSAKAAPILTCAIANTLGINVDRLQSGLFSRASSNNPGYRLRQYHHVLAIAARGRGDSQGELRHHMLGGGAKTETLGALYARGNLLRAYRQAMPVGEILRSLEHTETVFEWKPYTSLSVHVRLSLLKYLMFPRRTPGTAREISKLERLLIAAKGLSDKYLRDVNFIHQIATALRFRMLLVALLTGVWDSDLERRILELYGEQANLAGFVSTFRDLALARLLLMRHYSQPERKRQKTEALSLIERSFALASVLGDSRSVRRARRIKLLMKVY